MLGQYGLFEQDLKGLTGDDKLDALYELVATPKGKATSLDLYLQQNWSRAITLLASHDSEQSARAEVKRIEAQNKQLKCGQKQVEVDKSEKEHAYDKNQHPIAVFTKNYTTTIYGDAEKVVKLLQTDAETVYESQLRCSYQKPAYVSEYGEEEYKAPLSGYLKGKAKNEDCDGISTITVDFDSNIRDTEIEYLYVAKGVNREISRRRSLASYANAVNTYALQLKEELPFELQPTAIRFTGRGFQFIYDLAYTYYFNRDKEQGNNLQQLFVKDTIMWLRRSLELENNAFYDNYGKGILPPDIHFHLDKKFEQSLDQKRRVPGSLNTKSGLYAAYIYLTDDLLHNKHTLQDLIDYCKDNYREMYWAQNGIIKYVQKASKDFTPTESLFFAKMRFNALTRIVNDRYDEDRLVGSRHNFLTQITNCLADIEKLKRGGHEPSYGDIFNQAVSFQVEHFREQSLNHNETVSAVKGAMKRREKIIKRGDSTNLSNKVIVDFLDLTPEEEGILRGTTATAKRKAKAVQNKLNRAEKALYAYELHKEGYTYEDIAEALDTSTSTAHRYVTELYPRLQEEHRAELKGEKVKLEQQLKTTQRFLYEHIYERVTRIILAKKLAIKVFDFFSKKEKAHQPLFSDQQIVVGFVSNAVQDTLHNILRFASIDEMKLLRTKMDVLYKKLIMSQSFKNMINEYTLLALMDSSSFTREQYNILLSRADDKLNLLIRHLYDKHIKELEVPRLKAFYPNGLIANYYIEFEHMLPFKLLMTDSLSKQKHGLTNKERYTNRFAKAGRSWA